LKKADHLLFNSWQIPQSIKVKEFATPNHKE
jgi:hypothetical protein